MPKVEAWEPAIPARFRLRPHGKNLTLRAAIEVVGRQEPYASRLDGGLGLVVGPKPSSDSIERYDI